MLNNSVVSGRDNPFWKESISMSFREKSAWASLAVMLVVYVPYFVHVFRLFGRGELKGGLILGQFISAVLFQIFLLSSSISPLRFSLGSSRRMNAIRLSKPRHTRLLTLL